jgi:DNA-binding Lrp family transcriptional regulator
MNIRNTNQDKTRKYPKKDLSQRDLSEIILRTLRRNSRQRIIDISKKNNIPIINVFEGYHRLKSSIIIKNCSLIRYTHTVFKYRFFIVIEFKHYINSINDTSMSEEMLIDFLNMHKNTNTVSLTEHGLLLDVIFSNLDSYTQFITRIKEFDILSISAHQVYEDVCVEKFFS